MERMYKLVLIPSLILYLTMASTIDLYAADSKSAYSPRPTLSSINIEPDTYRNLFLGETLQLTATGTYSDGSTEDISTEVSWTVSNTTDLSISETGLLTVISQGNAAMSAAPGGPSGPGKVEFFVTADMSGVVSTSVDFTVLTSEGPSVYLQSGGNAENSNQSIYAFNTNQSGVKVTDGGVLALSNSSVTTSGDATFGGDGSSYGLNTAVLATSGGIITLSNSIITTTGDYGNAVFAYGEGSLVKLSNVKIKCTGEHAHGVDDTYKGTVIIEDSHIHTFGNMGCASLANDTGDGDVYATRVITTTEGIKSPGFYAIGAISIFKITDSRIFAKKAEGGMVTTGATVLMDNSDLIGGFIGVACSKGSTFIMNGGSLTSIEGPAFIVEAGPGKGREGGFTVEGQGAGPQGPGGAQGPGSGPGPGPGGDMQGPGGDMQGPGSMGDGLQGPGGEPAANLPTSEESNIIVKGGVEVHGGSGNIVEVKESSKAVFTAEDEDLTGNMIVDEDCGLDITLRNSTLTGKIEGASLTIESGSIWNVTGDSTLTVLSNKEGVSGKTVKNIIGNGHTVYYDKDLSIGLGGKTYKLAKGGKLIPR